MMELTLSSGALYVEKQGLMKNPAYCRQLVPCPKDEVTQPGPEQDDNVSWVLVSNLPTLDSKDLLTAKDKQG